MQRVFLFFMILTISGGANAQSITNVTARQEDKKIIVSYDMTGGTVGVHYDVKLFVSEDGGYSWEGPLTAVTDYTGVRKTDGITKQITWDVLNEPGREQLIGDKIAFKIQAIYLGENSSILPIKKNQQFEVHSTARKESSSSQTSSWAPCPGMPTITDPRDGQVYPTVKIGSQCWLQKNMNYQTENSWCDENKPGNCDVYGRLYDWETAVKVCPKGWHLPSDEEWTILTDYLGRAGVAGAKMKSISGWRDYDNNKGTNTSGFTALASGNRDDNGYFYGLGNYAYFWSSSQGNATSAWGRFLYDNNARVYRSSYVKTYGFSCKCLKD